MSCQKFKKKGDFNFKNMNTMRQAFLKKWQLIEFCTTDDRKILNMDKIALLLIF